MQHARVLPSNDRKGPAAMRGKQGGEASALVFMLGDQFTGYWSVVNFFTHLTCMFAVAAIIKTRAGTLQMPGTAKRDLIGRRRVA